MKAYTDLEQSKKLAEILPLESADSHYARKTHDFMGNPIDGKWSHPQYGNPNSKYAHYVMQNFSNYETIPCWSLAALLEVLPKEQHPELMINAHYKWICDISNPFSFTYEPTAGNNPLDAVFEMILNLNKLKML